MQPEEHSEKTQQPRPSRTERRVQAASDALRTLVRDLYAERFGAAAPNAPEMNLDLRFSAKAGENWSLQFDPPMAEQLIEQMGDAQAERDVFRKGRVYCFRCASSQCDHAVPSGSLCVFGGYDSTGRPEWPELAQAFVLNKDPRADQLFGPSSRVLALVELGRQLRGKQLAAFGRSSKTYAVLGQVVAGYFACPPAARSPHKNANGRLAITFQIVETRGADGRMELRLNVLSHLPDGGALDEMLGSGWAPSLFRARAIASREVEELQRRVADAREGGHAEDIRSLLRDVPRILHRLADHIERGDRQGRRRTQHAEARRSDQRPVPKAFEDAKAAGRESLYYDLKARTFVVCGAKGRTHAFSMNGRHVTSFQLKPGAAAFRVRTHRWRALEADEADKFKSLLRQQEHVA